MSNLTRELRRYAVLTYSIFYLELQKGQVFGGLTDGRTHRNPNPSILKCRMEEGKPYTIHHRARLHREESSMATSHLKGGQMQQEQRKIGNKKDNTKTKAGMGPSDVMFFR